MSDAPSEPKSDDDPAARADYAALVDACMHGDATPQQLSRLGETLRADPAALEAYLDQVRAHALLSWRSGSVTLRPASGMRLATEPLREVGGHRTDHRTPWWRSKSWAAAATVVLAAAVMWIVLRRTASPTGPFPPRGEAALAEVTEVHDVVWDERQSPLAVGAPVGPGEIAIRSGRLRLSSRADAIVTITGPARLRWLSAGRVQAIGGRITARVGPNGKGFLVEAPAADVVDLGTEFGVQVGPAGETSVVVFEGEVDLTPKPTVPSTTSPGTPPSVKATRMVKGQAVKVGAGGQLDRIVNVDRQAGAAGDWSLGTATSTDAVIAAVRDNRREPGDPKYYQVVHRGLVDDAPAYVDRCYQWNALDKTGLPEILRGADLVMTFNDDKHSPDLEITVTLARPATIYVLYKDTPIPTPDWLARDFVRTGVRIGLDEGAPDMPELKLAAGPGESIDHPFSVWRSKPLLAGEVTLGPNSPMHNSMYGIAAVPLTREVGDETK